MFCCRNTGLWYNVFGSSYANEEVGLIENGPWRSDCGVWCGDVEICCENIGLRSGNGELW